MRIEIGGSLTNRILEGHGVETPTVGMGATEIMYSDRKAGTLIEVSESRVVFQRDKVTRTDANGMSDAQQYSYEPDANGYTTIYTKRKGGFWVRKGDGHKSGQRLLIGTRDEHYDFSF